MQDFGSRSEAAANTSDAGWASGSKSKTIPRVSLVLSNTTRHMNLRYLKHEIAKPVFAFK
jgi:hypothetical protein